MTGRIEEGRCEGRFRAESGTTGLLSVKPAPIGDVLFDWGLRFPVND